MRYYLVRFSEEEKTALLTSLNRVSTTGLDEANTLCHLARLIEGAMEDNAKEDNRVKADICSVPEPKIVES